MRHDGSEINKRLDEIEAFVDSRFVKLVDYPDPEQFKKICELFIAHGYSGDESSEKRPVSGLISYIDRMADRSLSGERLIRSGNRKGQRYRRSAIKSYQTTAGILRKFAKASLVTEFPFERIDDTFYNKLSAFFYDELKLSVGYFGSNIRNIKLAMNEARAEGYHNFDFHNSRSFVKPTYESDQVYLTVPQLNAFQSHVFSIENGALDNARDWFIIGCWTGLRFSDFSTLRPEDMAESFIRIKMQKTSERVAIPFHPMLKKVIAKNNGGLPRRISNQKLNEYIKMAARQAGLTHKVIIRKNVGGVDFEEEHEFCDLITTHTARRSFATNMFKKGIPTLLIMAITGHKTEAAFLKYIRVSNEEKAMMMAELWKKIDWD